MVSIKKVFADWKEHMEDMFRRKRSELFYDIREDSDVEKFAEIVSDGQDALNDYENDLYDNNETYIYELFEEVLSEFLRDYDMTIDELGESGEDFRQEFDEALIMNTEALFNYDVLMFDRSYDIADSSEKSQWKKRALNYVSQKEVAEVLNNADGSGYIGVVVNAGDVIEAIRRGDKTVYGNNVVVGIHDWFNGAGYFVQGSGDYRLNLFKAQVDYGSYSVGDVFGTVPWKW